MVCIIIKTELEEEEKHNLPCTPSPNLYMTTSKDTIRLLRVVAILNTCTLINYIRKQLQLEVNEDPICLTISLEPLQKAGNRYSVLVQHKSILIYLQVHVLTLRSKHIYSILR